MLMQDETLLCSQYRYIRSFLICCILVMSVSQVLYCSKLCSFNSPGVNRWNLCSCLCTLSNIKKVQLLQCVKGLILVRFKTMFNTLDYWLPLVMLPLSFKKSLFPFYAILGHGVQNIFLQ